MKAQLLLTVLSAMAAMAAPPTPVRRVASINARDDGVLGKALMARNDAEQLQGRRALVSRDTVEKIKRAEDETDIISVTIAIQVANNEVSDDNTKREEAVPIPVYIVAEGEEEKRSVDKREEAVPIPVFIIADGQEEKRSVDKREEAVPIPVFIIADGEEEKRNVDKREAKIVSPYANDVKKADPKAILGQKA